MKQASVTAVPTTLSFETTLYDVHSWTIVPVPADESLKLPSRGQVMVRANLNGVPYETPLEPDGNCSHWFRLTDKMRRLTGLSAGDTATVEIQVIKDWPEPDVPADLLEAVTTDSTAHAVWQQITPMARWEWVRWTRSTNSDETRAKRIRVAISKMKSGHRRPCCWNRNLCTEPLVSKGGILIPPYRGEN